MKQRLHGPAWSSLASKLATWFLLIAIAPCAILAIVTYRLSGNSLEETIRQTLPEGFQRSEFLLEHGMVDAIVPRKELRQKLGQLLGLLG